MDEPVCPYTMLNYQNGRLPAVQRRAKLAGVAWISVNTAAPGRAGYLTMAGARQQIERSGAQVAAFLFDSNGDLGRMFGARTTPSFYVVGPDGRLAYQGALDVPRGKLGGRSSPALTSALADLKARRPVRLAETRPNGCAVEY
jgi:hypothetical protein